MRAWRCLSAAWHEARHVRRRQGRPPRGRRDRATRRARHANVLRARRCRRRPRADVARRGEAACADRPEEVLPHRRKLPRARGGVEAGQLVARDRSVDRLLPERRCDHRAGRADRLSRAADERAGLRARARRRRRQGGEVVHAGGGDGLRRRLCHLQRHHRARHPAPRDAQRRLLVLQGDRHLLPARAVDRHARRDPGPARTRDDAARQRRDSADLALRPNVDDDPGDPEPLLAARVLGGGRSLDRYRERRGGLQRRRRVALPPAGRRDRGGDRADRRAAQPGRLLGGRPPRVSRKAFITGITGQDGSYLAEILLEKGYEVYGMIRRSSSFNTARVDHIFGDIELVFGDLTDGSVLNQLMRTIRPDEVYNLGAQSHVRVSFDVPEYTADADAMGTLRLLDAIREEGVQCRFYQASSSEMFGLVRDVPQNEETGFHPRSPYGVSKVFSYWITRNYREAYGMYAVNGILFNHE